jgi:hypothetical protein
MKYEYVVTTTVGSHFKKKTIGSTMQDNVFQDIVGNEYKNTKFGHRNKTAEDHNNNITITMRDTKHMKIHLLVPALQVNFNSAKSRVMKYLKRYSENRMSFFLISTR